MIKIGIIEAGAVNPKLYKKYGNYSDMIVKWLEPSLKFSNVESIALYRSEPIPNPTSADIWIISGSKYGVYDNLPWIEPLKTFIRAINKKAVPLIGICFGHQIIAEAMGGKVVKSEKGWGIGVQEYTIQHELDWLRSSNTDHLRGLKYFYKGCAFHQDQVVKIPQECQVIAKNEFCPYAMLAYGPLAKPTIITIQTHPEFSSDYFKDLSLLRLNNPIPKKLVDQALINTDCKFYNDALATSFTDILLS